MDISIIISAIAVICTIFGWFVIHHMSFVSGKNPDWLL